MAGPRRRPYNFRLSAARRMFSSMFHPPLYTHAPYTRFSPFLDRSLSALTLSHATVRRRRGTEKKRKSRGKFHSADGGVAREFSTRVFPPPLGFYGRHDCPQPRGGRRGDFRPAGKSYRGAVNFFTRSLLVAAPRRGFKESLRPSFSVVSVEGLFPWRDRERARNEGARHAIKGQLETRERFPGKQPCCVPPSPHRSEIRGTIDSRNRGEQALRGLRDFLVTCAR